MPFCSTPGPKRSEICQWSLAPCSPPMRSRSGACDDACAVTMLLAAGVEEEAEAPCASWPPLMWRLSCSTSASPAAMASLWSSLCSTLSSAFSMSSNSSRLSAIKVCSASSRFMAVSGASSMRRYGRFFTRFLRFRAALLAAICASSARGRRHQQRVAEKAADIEHLEDLDDGRAVRHQVQLVAGGGGGLLGHHQHLQAGGIELADAGQVDFQDGALAHRLDQLLLQIGGAVDGHLAVDGKTGDAVATLFV